MMSNFNSLSKLSKKMVKLSRFRLGWSTTRTELPVLDFACTAQKRLTSEKKIAPRDSNMVEYPVPVL